MRALGGKPDCQWCIRWKYAVTSNMPQPWPASALPTCSPNAMWSPRWPGAETTKRSSPADIASG